MNSFNNNCLSYVQLWFYLIVSPYLFPVNGTADSLCVFKNIYVLNHGWHAGLVLNQEDLDSSFYGNKPSFPKARYLEIGWGDWDFYQSESRDINYLLLAKAILYPTKSVLHFVGFDDEVENYFPVSQIARVTISDSSFRNLVNFIEDSFEKDENGHAVSLKPGLYGKSIFYASNKYYIFPKTCNVWIAQALNEAGMDIEPLQYQQSDDLMARLRELCVEIIR